MAIRNWRWWHWLIISLVVGGVVGVAMNAMPVDDPSLPSSSWPTLRQRIDRKTDTGDSLVTQIRVSPVVVDNTGKKVQSVTYWERFKNKTTGKWEPVRQFRLVTPVPLSPASPSPDYGVLNFLAEKKKQIPTLDWRYEWWLSPRAMWPACLGASVLLIGVLWPLALKSLVKLGLAEPPDERMDLSQVKAVPTEAPTLVAKARGTAEDEEQLTALNANLAANVAGMALATPATAAAAAKGETPVRILSATGVDEGEKPAAAQEEDHDFKGEFYPVDRGPRAKSPAKHRPLANTDKRNLNHRFLRFHR
ncbi:MAG: hypothetical protein QM754_10055 [Tepidisphaeraceae bacterium]